jgi:hypothetical protein
LVIQLKENFLISSILKWNFIVGFLMDKTVIIIGKRNSSLTLELEEIVNSLLIKKFLFLETINDVNNLKEEELASFYIFTLAEIKLVTWKDFFQKIDPFYKIYYHENLFFNPLEQYLCLDFDFIFVGLERKKHLLRTLQYLHTNSLRKIPLSIFEIENHLVSNLIRKILFILPKFDLDVAKLKDIAQELDVDPKEIGKELEKNLNLNFTNFKKIISNYYKTNNLQE